MKWAVVSICRTRDMDHGDPELLGPFDDDAARDAELKVRYEDDSEEDVITISLLEIQDGKIVMTGAYIADLEHGYDPYNDNSEGGYGFPIYDDSE